MIPIQYIFLILEKMDSNRSSSISSTKTSSIVERKIRQDNKGVEIKKGGKGHSIAFVDIIGSRSLLETVEVESWKEYNVNRFELEMRTSCSGFDCIIC
jgi:hypothetical protein